MSNNNQIPYKIYLEESEMPKAWYNVRADMINKPAPLLDPETLKPITLEKLSSFSGWGQKNAPVPHKMLGQERIKSVLRCHPAWRICAPAYAYYHTLALFTGCHTRLTYLFPFGSPSDAHSARPSVLPSHHRQLSETLEACLLTHPQRFPPLKHICPGMSRTKFFSPRRSGYPYTSP